MILAQAASNIVGKPKETFIWTYLSPNGGTVEIKKFSSY